MKLRFLLLAVGFSLISAVASFSQSNVITPQEEPSSFYLGPVAGYNKSMHTVELKTFAQDPLCPTFVDGSDNGYYFGLSFEYLFGEVESSFSSIIGRLLYNSLPASLEQNDLDLPTRVAYIQGTDTVDVIENTSIIHLNSVKYDVITFEVMYKFNPIRGTGFGLTVGPTFDFAMTKTQDQRMDLIKPLNAQFKREDDGDGNGIPDYIDKGYEYTNNDRTIIISKGDIPESSAFRVGLKLGVQYEITLGKGGMYIVPAAYYNLGVTNLSSEFDWRVNALQVGFDLRFAVDNIF